MISQKELKFAEGIAKAKVSLATNGTMMRLHLWYKWLHRITIT